MTRESWHDGTYSHGWGSSAIVGVSWGLMGVHELTAGWATFLVKPKLGADWTGLQRICRRQCTQWRAKSTIGFVSARPWVVTASLRRPLVGSSAHATVRNTCVCAPMRVCVLCASDAWIYMYAHASQRRTASAL